MASRHCQKQGGQRLSAGIVLIMIQTPHKSSLLPSFGSVGSCQDNLLLGTSTKHRTEEPSPGTWPGFDLEPLVAQT